MDLRTSFRLAILPIFLAVSSSLQVADVKVPGLLVHIFDEGLVDRCKLKNFASFGPIETHPGADVSHLDFKFVLAGPIESAHLVLDVSVPKRKTLTALGIWINGVPQNLRLELTRNATFAKMDHAQLKQAVRLTIPMAALRELGCTLDQIFVMTNIVENCDAWLELQSNRQNKRVQRNAATIPDVKAGGRVDATADSTERQEVNSGTEGQMTNAGTKGQKINPGCRVLPLVVDLRDMQQTIEKNIVYPHVLDIGVCSQRCSISQYTPNALVRTILRENIRSGVNHTSSRQQLGQAVCAPTVLDPHALLYQDPSTNRIEYRVYQNMLVKKCVCF